MNNYKTENNDDKIDYGYSIHAIKTEIEVLKSFLDENQLLLIEKSIDNLAQNIKKIEESLNEPSR